MSHQFNVPQVREVLPSVNRSRPAVVESRAPMTQRDLVAASLGLRTERPLAQPKKP